VREERIVAIPITKKGFCAPSGKHAVPFFPTFALRGQRYAIYQA
jgi:hypothetical protein